MRRLKAELAQARDGGRQVALTTVAGIGHNHPPEHLEPYAEELEAEASTIAHQLDEAEAELAQPRPSPARLRSAARVMLDAATSVAKYCAKLGDIAAQAAAKKLGEKAVSWAGWGAVYYVLANNPLIKDLAEALLKFAGPG